VDRLSDVKRRHRSYFEIYRDILNAARRSKNTHWYQLFASVGLCTTGRHFLNDLVSMGFLECKASQAKRGWDYHTTKEGLAFMGKINDLLKLVEE